LAAAGANIEPDLSGDAEIRIRLDLARAPLAIPRQPGGVLAAADMTLANVVRLNIYARDVDELFKQFSRVNERFGDSRYATTVLGVGQVPARFLVMLEANRR
jgi:hypothetical protein